MMLLQSIILTLTTHSIYALAQLTFQTDPYRNTFTLKTPSLQQTFTRYYGGQQQVSLPTVGKNVRLHHQQQQQSLNIQQQQQQAQPHQFAPVQQYSDAYTVPQNFLADAIQQPQQYQVGIPQRNEYYSQPQHYQQPQQQQIYQSKDQQLQQQNYFQQLQSAQPILFASRQQEQQAAAAQSQLDGYSSSSTAAITNPQQHSQQNSNLLGVAFSPSDQVSHVKFSNGEGLKYNF